MTALDDDRVSTAIRGVSDDVHGVGRVDGGVGEHGHAHLGQIKRSRSLSDRAVSTSNELRGDGISDAKDRDRDGIPECSSKSSRLLGIVVDERSDGPRVRDGVLHLVVERATSPCNHHDLSCREPRKVRRITSNVGSLDERGGDVSRCLVGEAFKVGVEGKGVDDGSELLENRRLEFLERFDRKVLLRHNVVCRLQLILHIRH
mmetsp:Transcript_24639/g.41314  ORF Transcript_24639/g.41314 Transcript_24639/m.41314 type:complete len:203 (+) Transcript_24639:670-1278(+)